MYKIKDPRKKAHFLVDHGPSLRTSSLVGLIKFAYANNLIKKTRKNSIRAGLDFKGLFCLRDLQFFGF